MLKANVYSTAGYQVSTLLDLNGLLTIDIPKIWPHIEFDLCGICAVRQHDGRIAYTASAKLHVLFCPDLAVSDKSQLR